MNPHLLIVEADLTLAARMAEQLAAHGYRITLTDNGQAALDFLTSAAFDAIILDRSLPQGGGMSLVERLRNGAIFIPVLMLAEPGDADRCAEALNAGADGFATRPVDPPELDARIKALIRARQWQGIASQETIDVGDITLSPTRHAAWRNGKLLNLQNTEYRILNVLAHNADSVVTRAMLLKQVWNYDSEPATNLVESHIRRLRRKLTEFGDADPIRTIRGVGYMLRA